MVNKCGNSSDFHWPDLIVYGTAGQPWSRVEECRIPHFLHVCVCVFMSYCFTLLQQRKMVEQQNATTHTHNQPDDCIVICTDGCRVTIKATGSEPSCFCRCSSSCLLIEVEIRTSASIHKSFEAVQGFCNPLTSARKLSPVHPGTLVYCSPSTSNVLCRNLSLCH